VSEMHQLDERSKAALALLRDSKFRTAVDVASVDVIDLCERLLLEHRDLVLPLMAEDDGIGTVFGVLLGWILGFDLRENDLPDKISPDGFSERLLNRIHVVMTAAAWSIGNVEAFKRKQVN
jgi:hypothetical protein